MFDLSMPYDNDHPLFRLEVRHILWGQSPSQLRHYSLWMVVFIALAAFALWLLSISAEWRPSYMYIYWRLADLIGVLSFASIGANLILDLACILFTLNSMDSHKRKVWWELLLLTPAGGPGIIAAKHALAQVRTWRVMMIVVGTRIVTVVFTLVYFLVDWLTDTNHYINADMIWFIPMVLVFAGAYLIAPLWRMRAMTALGLWISARTRHSALAGLTGFGAMILVWVTQSCIMGFLAGVAAVFLAPIVLNSVLACGLFVDCVIVTLVIYHYYNILAETSLYNALRNISRE